MNETRDLVTLLATGDAFLIDGHVSITELISAFEIATHEFEKDCDHEGRRGARIAFAALYGFAKALVPDLAERDLLRPAAKLGSVLESLDSGDRGGKFLAAKRKGRPPEAMEFNFLKGTTTAAVEILMLSGKSEQEANTFVAKNFSRYKSNITPTKIANWRSKVRESLPAQGFAENQATKCYQEWMKAWDLSELPAEQFIKTHCGDYAERKLSHLVGNGNTTSAAAIPRRSQAEGERKRSKSASLKVI